jgi:hypothetical protein
VTCLDADFVDFGAGPLGDSVDDQIPEEVVLKIRRAVGDVVPLLEGEVYPRIE